MNEPHTIACQPGYQPRPLSEANPPPLPPDTHTATLLEFDQEPSLPTETQPRLNIDEEPSLHTKPEPPLKIEQEPPLDIILEPPVDTSPPPPLVWNLEQ